MSSPHHTLPLPPQLLVREGAGNGPPNKKSKPIIHSYNQTQHALSAIEKKRVEEAPEHSLSRSNEPTGGLWKTKQTMAWSYSDHPVTQSVAMYLEAPQWLHMPLRTPHPHVQTLLWQHLQENKGEKNNEGKHIQAQANLMEWLLECFCTNCYEHRSTTAFPVQLGTPSATPSLTPGSKRVDGH